MSSLQTSPPTDRLFNLTKSVSLEWMKTDPGACANWLDSLIPSLTEEQRQTFNDAYSAFRRTFKNDPAPLEIRLATSHQAQNPLVLDTRKFSGEQKAAFLEELAEVLPDYHASLTAPRDTHGQEIYDFPEKFASTLQPADFRNLSAHNQSNLVSGLTNASPEKATKFLIEMNDLSILPRVLLQWHDVAPREALAFAKTIPATPDFQPTLLSFAMNTARTAQEVDTLQHIEFLQSPEDQEKVLAERKD